MHCDIVTKPSFQLVTSGTSSTLFSWSGGDKQIKEIDLTLHLHLHCILHLYLTPTPGSLAEVPNTKPRDIDNIQQIYPVVADRQPKNTYTPLPIIPILISPLNSSRSCN